MKNVGGESGRGGGGQTTGWWLAETDRQMGRLTSRDMDLYTGKRLSKSQENNHVLQQMITDDNNVLYLDNTFQNRVTNSHQQRNNLLYNTVDAVREIHTSSANHRYVQTLHVIMLQLHGSIIHVMCDKAVLVVW